MKENLSGCSITNALNVMGGRWRGVIIYYLLNAESGSLRFSELRRAIPNISQRVLTQDLRGMEGAGVLTRTIYAVVPARVDYSLTARGQALRPIIEALCRWGAEVDASAARPKKPGRSPRAGHAPKASGSAAAGRSRTS